MYNILVIFFTFYTNSNSNFFIRMSDTTFNLTFSIGKHPCTLIQHGDGYELRVDNQSFNHVMDLGICYFIIYNRKE